MGEQYFSRGAAKRGRMVDGEEFANNLSLMVSVFLRFGRDPSLILWVKALARGFRNQQNFINAIYFHCGGLDMDPGH